MSMVIANNMQAVNTKRQFAISGRGQSSAMEKLSSGYKINTGKDDPSGLVISEKLRSQLNGLKRAQQNTEEAINVMGIAEGALNEMNAILKKMKALAIHSNNTGVTSPDQIAADQAEMDSAIQTLDRIAQTTKFSEDNLLNGAKDIAYDTTTSVKGTQQNSLLNTRETSFKQIFKRDDYAVAISFTGTANADEITGAGEVDFTKQAAKAYLEVDTSSDPDNQAQIQQGKFTQDQQFTLTGTKGSRAFTFNKGETVATMVSQIKSVADSTGIDAALVFNSDQRIHMTASGDTGSDVEPVAQDFTINGINDTAGEAVEFKLDPTANDKLMSAMEDAGVRELSFRADVRGSGANEEVILMGIDQSGKEIQLTSTWDGKASTLADAIKTQTKALDPVADKAQIAMLNAMADGGLTAAADISVDDSELVGSFTFKTADTFKKTEILVSDNLFKEPAGFAGNSGKMSLTLDTEKLWSNVYDSLETEAEKTAFTTALEAGQVKIKTSIAGSTEDDFRVLVNIGTAADEDAFGKQSIEVDLSGLAKAPSVTTTVDKGIFAGSSIKVTDADKSSYGYNSSDSVSVMGGMNVALGTKTESTTGKHTEVAESKPAFAAGATAGGIVMFNDVFDDGSGLALKVDLGAAFPGAPLSAQQQADLDRLNQMEFSISQNDGGDPAAPSFTISAKIGNTEFVLQNDWDGTAAADFNNAHVAAGSSGSAATADDMRLINSYLTDMTADVVTGVAVGAASGTGVEGLSGFTFAAGTNTVDKLQAAMKTAGYEGFDISLELGSDVAIGDVDDPTKYKYNIVLTASNGDKFVGNKDGGGYTAAELAAGITDSGAWAVSGTGNAGVLAELQKTKFTSNGLIDGTSQFSVANMNLASSADIATTLATALTSSLNAMDGANGLFNAAGAVTAGTNFTAATVDAIIAGFGTDTEKLAAFHAALMTGDLKVNTSVSDTAWTGATDSDFTINVSLTNGDGSVTFASGKQAMTAFDGAAGGPVAFSGADAGPLAGLSLSVAAAAANTGFAADLATGSIASAVPATYVLDDAKVNAKTGATSLAGTKTSFSMGSFASMDIGTPAEYAQSKFADAAVAAALTTNELEVYQGLYNAGHDNPATGNVKIKFTNFDTKALSDMFPDLAAMLADEPDGADDTGIQGTINSDGDLVLTFNDSNDFGAAGGLTAGQVAASVVVDLSALKIDEDGQTVGEDGWATIASGPLKGMEIKITNDEKKSELGYSGAGKLQANGDLDAVPPVLPVVITPITVTGVTATKEGSSSEVSDSVMLGAGNPAGQVGGLSADGADAARDLGTVAIFNNQMEKNKDGVSNGQIAKGVTGIDISADGAASVQLGKNTDGQGRIFVKFTDDGSFELYKDSSMSAESLVATGINGQEITQSNNSGLEGLTLNITGSELTKVNGVYFTLAGIEGLSQNQDPVTGELRANDYGVINNGDVVGVAGKALFDETKTLITGVELGKNTDADGRIYLETVYDHENGTVRVNAYKDRNKTPEDLVAQSELMDISDFAGAAGGSATFVLSEKRNADNTAGTGLGIVLSTDQAGFGKLIADGQNVTLGSTVEFKNLGARIFAQDYGSANFIKATQDKGNIFSYYAAAGDNDSKRMIDATSGGVTVQVNGQDATLSVNGTQVKTNGLELSMATQDIQADLVFNQGKVGSTTMAQVGYETASIFTKIGALNLGSVEAETEGKYAGLSGLMANAGHVTNERVDNFQGGMQLQLGEGAGDQNRTVVAIKSLTSENLGRVTQGGYWEGNAVYSEKTFTMKDVFGGGAASLKQSPTLAMAIIEQSIADVSELRAQIGAVQTNMLQTNSNNLAVTMENIQKTESGIRDADMADEMTEFTKNQVLQSAAMSMMSQANQSSQNVLQLLR